ncbi:Hypothetical_protein [Hexamita inflata]|uniref:Hypothetical_protein n=1 Tax=Hexamita inflata TaxID=28002 RepID=A0AA86UHK9_9EUKA|nr:Hypothetical protein HINF_LOCUS43724 [Hexamita inflata]
MKHLEDFKVHSTNGDKITLNKGGNSRYITGIDRVWGTHYCTTISKLIQVIGDGQSVSLHGFSSQSCEHLFGFVRSQCRFNNSLQGMKQVLMDLALMNYLAATSPYITKAKKYAKQTTQVVTLDSKLQKSELVALNELSAKVEALLYGPTEAIDQQDPDFIFTVSKQLQQFWKPIFNSIQNKKEKFEINDEYAELEHYSNSLQQSRIQKIQQTAKYNSANKKDKKKDKE